MTISAARVCEREERGVGRRAALPRDTRKLLEAMYMFLILTMVMISQVYTYVKICQILLSVEFIVC